MLSKYLLVEWVDENRYSVITRSQITNNSEKNLQDEVLIGSTILVAFGKSKTYNAKVLQCGSKTDMKHEQSELISQLKQAQNKNGIAEIDLVLGGTAVQPDDYEAKYRILFSDYEDLKRKYEEKENESDQLKNERDTLKRKCMELESQDQSRDEVINSVDIGNQVMVSRRQLDTISISCGGDSSAFARALLRAVFSPEDLQYTSLYGLVCNANKKAIPRPVLDETKRDAVLNYTYAKFNYTDGKASRANRRGVIASLSSMLLKLSKKD